MFGNMKQFQEKMMNRFFRRVNGVVWDLMTGKAGISTKDGIVTLEGEGDSAQVSINMIEQFGIPIPAFAQNTPVDNVKVGDLIWVNNQPKGWVIQIKEGKAVTQPSDDDGNASTAVAVPKKFSLMSPAGTTHTWTPPKVSMLGFESGVMVLQSLTGMFGQNGLGDMQNQLMPMFMMGGLDGGDLEDIMPMLLMSQSGALGGNNFLQTYMTMSMMKGMFGGEKNAKFDKHFSGRRNHFDS